jgi:hypothetical protein
MKDRLKLTMNRYMGLLLLVAGLLGSCTTQEPIRIVVTPTPAPTETTVLVATNTLPVSTDTEIPPSPFLTPTQVGDGTYFGPIVGPDYTPPPTTTPRATASPEVIASATPEQPTQAFGDLPALAPELMGVQLYYNLDADSWWQVIQRTKPIGVQWIKMQANWDFLQPNGPDEFETSFRLFQSHVQRAHNDGFRVLVSIAKAPDWARSTADQDGPPADPQALAYFIRFMLDRVGEQISAIEVWNEPNLIREWTGNLEFSGAGYMQLFRPAYDAVRSYSGSMPVITAGLAPTGSNLELGSVDDREYLQQMYNAGLADPYYTNIAIGIHPYSWGNPPDARCCDNVSGLGWDDNPHFFFLNTIESYREIMVRNGHSNVTMWSTEFGWATWEGLASEPPEVWMNYNSALQQAEYTMRAFEIAQSRDYMGPMFLWNMNFANPTLIEQRNEMVGYSLLVPGLDIRPLYHALASRPR